MNAKSLFINEVMNNNKVFLADVDGDYPDWIELYNSSNKAINLKNYGLSDNKKKLKKWTIPDVEIPPKGYILIFASGKNITSNELHTNFSLNNEAEKLFLSRPNGKIIDWIQLVDVAADLSYGRVENGGNNWQIFSTPTAFSSNTSGTIFNKQNAILLNEVQYANDKGIQDSYGQNSDWIELYNNGSQTVNLSGYAITNNKIESQKWIFPNVNINAGEFLLIFASGRNLKQEELHCNFKLNDGGEDIFLYDKSGDLIDFISDQQLTIGQSAGRIINGTGLWEKYYYNTPGKSNEPDTIKRKLNFSHKAGQYTEAFELAISFKEMYNDDELKIYYTTDGSEPTTNSNLYNSPLKIASRDGEPNYYSSEKFKTTLTPYIPIDEVFKINIIRCQIYKNNKPASKIYTKSYMIHPDLDRYTVPMVSIVSDPDNLFGNKKGIYMVGDNYDGKHQNTMHCFLRGKEWERKAHFEFFMDDKKIAQNGGIRIQGGGSRRNPQKSFRLYARSEYDSESTFDYPFFPEKPIKQYKRLILRGQQGSNDSYMTDEIFSNICRDVNNIARMATRPVVVFLNGEYWGLYHLRERIDKHYLEDNFGVDKNHVTLLKKTPYNPTCRVEGNEYEYIALLNYLKENDLNDPEVYKVVEQKIDLENFATYLIAEFWSANSDWPIHNIRYWKAKGDTAKWRWILFDIDFGLRYHEEPSIFNYCQNLNTNNNKVATEMGNLLFKSKAFVSLFTELFEHHIKTTFSPERVACEIITYQNLIKSEMEEQLSRHPVGHMSMKRWNNNVEGMYKTFTALRPCEIRKQILEQFGVKIDVGDCKPYTPTNNPCNETEAYDNQDL